jgi:hypothetical protein
MEHSKSLSVSSNPEKSQTSTHPNVISNQAARNAIIVIQDSGPASPSIEISKRKRPATPDDNDDVNKFEPRTPIRSNMRTRTVKNPRTPETPALSEEALVKRQASAIKIADALVVKAANAAKRKEAVDVRKAEAQRKKDVAQWKQNWKDWVALNQRPHDILKEPIQGKSVNVTSGKDFFGLSSDELKCIPHRLIPNRRYPSMPSRAYSWRTAGFLAFQKEAILSGEPPHHNNDTSLLRGKKLFEDKHANGYVGHSRHRIMEL